MQLSYTGAYHEGLDMVWVADGYGYDAVSMMGYLAASGPQDDA